MHQQGIFGTSSRELLPGEQGTLQGIPFAGISCRMSNIAFIEIGMPIGDRKGCNASQP
jgi:hypothetical protein